MKTRGSAHPALWRVGGRDAPATWTECRDFARALAPPSPEHFSQHPLGIAWISTASAHTATSNPTCTSRLGWEGDWQPLSTAASTSCGAARCNRAGTGCRPGQPRPHPVGWWATEQWVPEPGYRLDARAGRGASACCVLPPHTVPPSGPAPTRPSAPFTLPPSSSHLVVEEAVGNVLDRAGIHRVDAREQLGLGDAAPVDQEIAPDVLRHACAHVGARGGGGGWGWGLVDRAASLPSLPHAAGPAVAGPHPDPPSGWPPAPLLPAPPHHPPVVPSPEKRTEALSWFLARSTSVWLTP